MFSHFTCGRSDRIRGATPPGIQAPEHFTVKSQPLELYLFNILTSPRSQGGVAPNPGRDIFDRLMDVFMVGCACVSPDLHTAAGRSRSLCHNSPDLNAKDPTTGSSLWMFQNPGRRRPCGGTLANDMRKEGRTDFELFKILTSPRSQGGVALNPGATS